MKKIIPSLFAFGCLIALAPVASYAITLPTGSAVISNGAITSITITNGGSGLTVAPVISFTDSSGGTGATATATLYNGSVSSITVTNGGSGYNSATTLVNILPAAGDLPPPPPDPTDPTPGTTPDPTTKPGDTPDPNAGSSNKLINLSTRGFCDTLASGAALIAGFVIEGNEDKQVLIRGLGPSLANQGVTGSISDPWIYLTDASGNVITSNDNWQTDPGASQIQGTLFEPGNSLDAAMVVSGLSPGAYTAILAGVGDVTGVALLEVNEFDASTVDNKLINLSTRGFCDTLASGGARIAGFVIEGDEGTTKDVLIRALGPSLGTHFGVQGAIADPWVYIIASANPTVVIGSNDNWQTAADASAIQGTLFEPNNALDAAFIVRDLAPGAYTAVAAGVGDVTGVVLLEVNEYTGN
jgi:hypothetical protein